MKACTWRVVGSSQHDQVWSSHFPRVLFHRDPLITMEVLFGYRKLWFHVSVRVDLMSLLGSCVTINQSIKSSICKAPLHQSSQRRLLWVGLYKEPSLKARLELFANNITVLEMRWQHVKNLGCCDAETARTITGGPSTIMSSLSAERSWERKGTETIGEQMSRKYTGDWPWIQSYVISAILNVMRWDTGSRWSMPHN